MKSKRNILVYISGVYFSWGQNRIPEAIAQARAAAIQIWDAGFTAICPHLNTSHFERDCKCEQEDYLEGDLEILKHCDIIFFLPNYYESEGALAEYKLALSDSIPMAASMETLEHTAAILISAKPS